MVYFIHDSRYRLYERPKQLLEGSSPESRSEAGSAGLSSFFVRGLLVHSYIGSVSEACTSVDQCAKLLSTHVSTGLMKFRSLVRTEANAVF